MVPRKGKRRTSQRAGQQSSHADEPVEASAPIMPAFLVGDGGGVGGLPATEEKESASSEGFLGQRKRRSGSTETPR